MRWWIHAALIGQFCWFFCLPSSAEPKETVAQKLRERRLQDVGSSAKGKSKLRKLDRQRRKSRHSTRSKAKPNEKTAGTNQSPPAEKNATGKPVTARPSSKPDQPSAAPQPRKPRAPIKPVPLNPTEEALSRALQMRVEDRGPSLPWKVTVTNVGASPVRVYEDMRLLWLSTVTPTQRGKTKDVECRLPTSMVPTFAPDRHRVTLASGGTLSFEVDPRFYCFDRERPRVLQPGTRVEPHYGWPEKARKVWRGGKLTRVRLGQEAPFAFKPSPEGDLGLREVSAPSFELDERYAVWQPEPGKTRGDVDPDKAFRLSMTQGADASGASSVSVRVRLENLTQVTQRVYFKEDHLSFIIRGPDGTVRCDADTWRGVPDAQNLSILGPGKHKDLTVRLREFCADPIFTRAGFYYVQAVLPRPLTQAELSSGDEQSDDERPELSTRRPALVRIQRGEEPFVHWAPQRFIGFAPAAAATPSDSPAPEGH